MTDFFLIQKNANINTVFTACVLLYMLRAWWVSFQKAPNFGKFIISGTEGLSTENLWKYPKEGGIVVEGL